MTLHLNSTILGHFTDSQKALSLAKIYLKGDRPLKVEIAGFICALRDLIRDEDFDSLQKVELYRVMSIANMSSEIISKAST